MYLKFSTDWFEELKMAIYVSKHGADTGALADKSAVDKDLSTSDMYDKIHQIAKEQIDSAIAHYKPQRLTFLMVAGGTATDAIIGSYALYHKIPLIQFNQTDDQSLYDIEDKAKKVRKFAKVISDQVYIYKSFKKSLRDAKISPNKAFDLENC